MCSHRSHQPKFTTTSHTVDCKARKRFDRNFTNILMFWQSLIWYALRRVNRIKRPKRESVSEGERERQTDEWQWQFRRILYVRDEHTQMAQSISIGWHISPLHRLVSVLCGVFLHATICLLMSNKHFNFILSFLLVFRCCCCLIYRYGDQKVG